MIVPKFYIDKQGGRRPTTGNPRGGKRHGVAGGARQQQRKANIESGNYIATLGPEAHKNLDLRVACLRIGLTASSLQRKEASFLAHRDSVDADINANVAVRHNDLIARPQSLKRSSSSSCFALADVQSADNDEIVVERPEAKKRCVARKHELLPAAQQRMAYPGLQEKSLSAPMTSASVLARQFRVTRPTVQYSRCGMAEIQTKKCEEVEATAFEEGPFRFSIGKVK